MRRWQGAIVAALLAGVIALIAVPAITVMRKDHARANRQKCASQLISLGQAILFYSYENHGALPKSWKEVLVTQDATTEVFVCPTSQDTPATGDDINTRANQLLAGGHCSYQYLGNETMRMRELTDDIVLAAENPHHHGSNFEINVLFGNFRVRHMTGASSKQILDAIARGERPVRYAGKDGQVMRKSSATAD